MVDSQQRAVGDLTLVGNKAISVLPISVAVVTSPKLVPGSRATIWLKPAISVAAALKVIHSTVRIRRWPGRLFTAAARVVILVTSAVARSAIRVGPWSPGVHSEQARVCSATDGHSGKSME